MAFRRFSYVINTINNIHSISRLRSLANQETFRPKGKMCYLQRSTRLLLIYTYSCIPERYWSTPCEIREWNDSCANATTYTQDGWTFCVPAETRKNFEINVCTYISSHRLGDSNSRVGMVWQRRRPEDHVITR